MMQKLKKSMLSIMAFSMVFTGSKPAFAISWEEIIVGIGTGLISGAICRELGASRDLQAFCAIGGAFVGTEVAKEMNRQDAEAFNRAQEDAFRGDLNRPYEWDARSRSGIRGRLIVVEEGYHYQTRETCRVYESQVYYSRGRSENKRTVVCQRSNGGLYTIESVNYFRNGRWTGGQTVETETRPQPRRPGRPRHEPIRQTCEGWTLDDVFRGDRVYTRRGTVASFRRNEIRNGTLAVYELGSEQRYYANDIAISGCHYGIQTGTRVSTTSRSSGVVVGIFMNGDVVVETQGYLRVFQRHEVFFKIMNCRS